MKEFNFVVCYSKSDEYNIEDVKKLRYNLNLYHPEAGLVVYGDDNAAAAYCDNYIPLRRSFSKKSWWCCVEAFRHVGPTIFFGLDTVIIKPINEIIAAMKELKESSIIMLRPFNQRFYLKKWMASGIIAWNGNYSFVESECPDNVKELFFMEEEYTTRKLRQNHVKIIEAQSIANHGIKSFKRHYLTPNPSRWDYDGAEPKIIVFHGPPRPGELEITDFENGLEKKRVERILKARGVL